MTLSRIACLAMAEMISGVLLDHPDDDRHEHAAERNDVAGQARQVRDGGQAALFGHAMLHGTSVFHTPPQFCQSAMKRFVSVPV